MHNCGTRRIRNTYDAAVIKIEFQGNERRLLHCCFFSWGYRGTPIRPTELLNFISDINYNRDLLIKEAIDAKWMNANDISPISIYCLTGTGRSATVIALDICFRKLDDTAKRTCGPLLDVQDVVLRLRTRRAMAIQKAEQYLFIHLAALEYAVRQRYLAEKSYSEAELDNYFYQKTSPSKEVTEKGNENKPTTPKN
ncbi:unnamed protein product [Heligmosomoides polygyrus]|uniref:protein-tyrosine-phosphatase n=1 Tax=Heligmosomoides polygyrus TaxID=6339 RepID=A0A3P8FI25_HELPZ|nr:unnamed protein product [Heligmosomoides polygyrus]